MVWPHLTNALRCLEIMDAVWEVVVGVRLIDEVVEHLDDFQNCEFAFVQLEPLFTLSLDKIHCLVCVHGRVCELDHILTS